MICPRCNKFYFKKTYFDKHIKSNVCLKKMSSPSDNLEEDIENAIKKVTDQITNREKIENTPNILERDIENVIHKVVKENINDPDYKQQIDLLTIELNLLKERVSMLEKMETNEAVKQNMEIVCYDNTKTTTNIRAVKKEKIDMDLEIAKTYFNFRDLESDVSLLTKYYFENIEKQNYPIRTNKKNELIFWNGEEWIVDNGSNLKIILAYNLRKIYTKINIVPENNAPSPDYLNNQEHINNLNNKKYQISLYNLFLEKSCV